MGHKIVLCKSDGCTKNASRKSLVCRDCYVQQQGECQPQITGLSSMLCATTSRQAAHARYMKRRREELKKTKGSGQGEAGDEPGDSASTKKAKLCETEKEGGFHGMSAFAHIFFAVENAKRRQTGRQAEGGSDIDTENSGVETKLLHQKGSNVSARLTATSRVESERRFCFPHTESSLPDSASTQEAANFQPVFTNNFVPRTSVQSSKCKEAAPHEDWQKSFADRVRECQEKERARQAAKLETMEEEGTQDPNRKRIHDKFGEAYTSFIQKKKSVHVGATLPIVSRSTPSRPPPSMLKIRQNAVHTTSLGKRRQGTRKRTTVLTTLRQQTAPVNFAWKKASTSAPVALAPRGRLLLQEALCQIHCPNNKRKIELFLARFEVPTGHGAAAADDEEAGEFFI